MNFERTISAILAISAAVIAGTLLYREVGAGAAQRQSLESGRYSRFEEWGETLAVGRRVGPADAMVQIVEFSDLECPFCRRFHAALAQVRERFPEKVALTFVHFPLSMHKFAREGALAAECANAQGKFGEYVESIFTQQDSIGLKSWTSYAASASVPDTAALSKCVKTKEWAQHVDANVSLGQRIGVQSTPTIAINGWRFAVPPSEPQLMAIVEALANGGAMPEAAQTAAQR